MAKKSEFKPRKIDEWNWFYEMPSHLLLVHEVRDLKTGEYIRTDQIKIYWRRIKTKLPMKKRKAT